MVQIPVCNILQRYGRDFIGNIIWASEQTCVCAIPVFRDVQRMTSPLRMTANAKAAPADFIVNNGFSGAKEKGVWRLEGKDYVVKEGDVLVFKFNV